MAEPATDVYVLGAGVKTPDHLTLETVGALRRSRLVFSIYPLSDEVTHQLGLSAELRCLLPMFESSGLRRDTYQAIAETILDAVESARPVAFLTPGNPVVSDSVAQHLLSQGKARGFNVRLLPAVSSLDTVMADLTFDVSPALQIYDASWLVSHNMVPSVHAACLLLQVTTFGTALTTMGRTLRAGALAELGEYLQRFYPPDHEVVFVQSETRFSPGLQKPLPVCTLRDVEGVIPGTLYIPRLRDPEPDLAFGARMFDKEAFDAKFERRQKADQHPPTSEVDLPNA